MRNTTTTPPTRRISLRQFTQKLTRIRLSLQTTAAEYKAAIDSIRSAIKETLIAAYMNRASASHSLSTLSFEQALELDKLEEFNLLNLIYTQACRSLEQTLPYVPASVLLFDSFYQLLSTTHDKTALSSIITFTPEDAKHYFNFHVFFNVEQPTIWLAKYLHLFCTFAQPNSEQLTPACEHFKTLCKRHNLLPIAFQVISTIDITLPAFYKDLFLTADITNTTRSRTKTPAPPRTKPTKRKKKTTSQPQPKLSRNADLFDISPTTSTTTDNNNFETPPVSPTGWHVLEGDQDENVSIDYSEEVQRFIIYFNYIQQTYQHIRDMQTMLSTATADQKQAIYQTITHLCACLSQLLPQFQSIITKFENNHSHLSIADIEKIKDVLQSTPLSFSPSTPTTSSSVNCSVDNTQWLYQSNQHNTQQQSTGSRCTPTTAITRSISL